MQKKHEEVRADRLLLDVVAHSSRSEVNRWFKEKQVKRAETALKKGDLVFEGEEISLLAATEWLRPASASDVVLVEQSENFLAFSKPAGMPTLPVIRSEGGSLADHVAYDFPECIGASPDAPWECGIGHRLDTFTSGVVVVARTHNAYCDLRQAFDDEKVEKSYLALVEGDAQEAFFEDRAIVHHGSDSKRMTVFEQGKSNRGTPQPAFTQAHPIWGDGERTLMFVTAKGGRRHQVRVHAAAKGFPLAGDTLYGGLPCPPLEHHALHAFEIAVLDFDATAPLPASFLDACTPLANIQTRILAALKDLPMPRSTTGQTTPQ
ncbi:MAG: RluA family pseudouridine synthase [Deltaproteobacteria bacterium]|nr:RluA family pseudouridine synthase [Deltaproteobacteria bacterium]